MYEKNATCSTGAIQAEDDNGSWRSGEGPRSIGERALRLSLKVSETPKRLGYATRIVSVDKFQLTNKKSPA